MFFPEQAELTWQIILILASTRQQTKEQVRQSQTEYTMNLNNLFSDIDCFEGTFSLQIKEGSHSYQIQPRGVAYELQKPLTGDGVAKPSK